MKQGWEIKKLGEVCDIICGQDYKSVKDDNGKYPIYGTGGIMGYASQYRCPANSVIIGRKGSINNPLFVETEFWNVDTAFGVVPNEDILHPKFFYLFCKDYDFTRHDVSVTIPSLRRTDILKINVPVPPIAEQEKIVDELDCLSGIIEKKKQQLKELDNLAQSIFYEMFGDPVENDKGWEVKTYGSEFQISSGGTPDTKNNLYWDNGDISWIGSNLCHDEIIYKNDGKYITKDGFDNSSAKEYKSGYVLVALVGATIGRTALLRFNTTTNQNVAGINVPANENFVPEFIFYHLQKLYELFMGIGNGKFKMANLRFIRELPLIVPPLTLQQDFASKIESIEKQKEQIAQSIKETETLFNSRMDYYFN